MTYRQHELLQQLEDGDPEIAAELTAAVGGALEGVGIQERTFYLMLYAVKHYRTIDNPEYDLVDYQLAAETVPEDGSQEPVTETTMPDRPWTDADSLADAVAALRDRAAAVEGGPCDACYAAQLDAILAEHAD